MKEFPGFDLPEPARSGQLSIADIGTDLSDVTFTVLDFETTGADRGGGNVTEIGAVRVRGGRIDGEFQTLVNPAGQAISPFVQRLTGISNSMVVTAPEMRAVLPSFLEFARGTVLVAHNAPFDIGILRRACEEHDYPWPSFPVVDTLTLARRLLPKTEVRNHKLGTLAQHFGTATDPEHRALADARATTELLHHLFDRLDGYGVTTLEELLSIKPKGLGRRRTKLHLAENVPSAPGVYMFLDGARRVLYIGKSRDMRSRVRSYFTAGETRGRMTEMVTAAQEVTTIPCATEIEAAVREVRLIGELAPPYNRRSKRPERQTWLKFTDEVFPRLSAVRSRPPRNLLVAGPFSSHKSALQAKQVLEQLYPLKTCTQNPRSEKFRPCAASQVDACGGPCSGVTDEQAYQDAISGLEQFATGNTSDFSQQLHGRLRQLSQNQRFETAGETLDAAVHMLRVQARAEAADLLKDTEQITAARPQPDGSWELALIRWGRLAASETAAKTSGVLSAAQAIEATAAHVEPDQHTLLEEHTLLSGWLYAEGTVLISSTAPLLLPRTGFSYASAQLGSSGRGG